MRGSMFWDLPLRLMVETEPGGCSPVIEAGIGSTKHYIAMDLPIRLRQPIATTVSCCLIAISEQPCDARHLKTNRRPTNSSAAVDSYAMNYVFSKMSVS